jgi:hypothetical protein
MSVIVHGPYSEKRGRSGWSTVPAHTEIRASIQRDAAKCEKCGGPGRIAMRTHRGGGYDAEWVCGGSCPPPAKPGPRGWLQRIKNLLVR